MASPQQSHFSEENLFSQGAQRSEPRSRSQTRCPLRDFCGLGSVPSVKCMGSSGVWNIGLGRVEIRLHVRRRPAGRRGAVETWPVLSRAQERGRAAAISCVRPGAHPPTVAVIH